LNDGRRRGTPTLVPNSDKASLNAVRGVLAAAFAIFEALLFLVSEHQEMEAMHGSCYGLFLAGLPALGFAAFDVLVFFCFDTLCAVTRHQIEVFTSLLSQTEFLL
jgi:hypothetical protein